MNAATVLKIISERFTEASVELRYNDGYMLGVRWSEGVLCYKHMISEFEIENCRDEESYAINLADKIELASQKNGYPIT